MVICRSPVLTIAFFGVLMAAAACGTSSPAVSPGASTGSAPDRSGSSITRDTARSPGTGAAPTTSVGAATSATGDAASTVPHSSGGTAPDHTHLPVGDGKVSTSAQKGFVFSCQTGFGGGGAFASGSWIRGDGTWDATGKPEVDGDVSWPQASFTIQVSGTNRVITGNDLPEQHTTGVFPVQSADDAYRFDRNPNSIRAQSFSYSLPASPQVASSPSCTSGGPIGVLISGVQIFNALDAGGLDAVAHEIQDHCDGHPQPQGAYHYHSLSDCLTDGSPAGEHSSLVGYALDGFGIFGVRGEGGAELSTADLDECHGHTHDITWDGQPVTMYHYHATADYPYTVGCYRGTPVRTGLPGPGAGGPGGPGGPPPR